MEADIYTKILLNKIEVKKILWDSKCILQFDNDPKHKSLHIYELNLKNSIKIID